MLQIVDVIANENALYKRNEFESILRTFLSLLSICCYAC